RSHRSRRSAQPGDGFFRRAPFPTLKWKACCLRMLAISAGRRSRLRQLAHQPAMFAALRFLRFVDFPERYLEIVTEFLPSPLLDVGQAGSVKLRSGDVAKFGDARLVLVK